MRLNQYARWTRRGAVAQVRLYQCALGISEVRCGSINAPWPVSAQTTLQACAWPSGIQLCTHFALNHPTPDGASSLHPRLDVCAVPMASAPVIILMARQQDQGSREWVAFVILLLDSAFFPAFGFECTAKIEQNCVSVASAIIVVPVAYD